MKRALLVLADRSGYPITRAAPIANAVFHATGLRLTGLPFTAKAVACT